MSSSCPESPVLVFGALRNSKNSDNDIPRPAQIFSSVGMLGQVLRLNISLRLEYWLLLPSDRVTNVFAGINLQFFLESRFLSYILLTFVCFILL